MSEAWGEATIPIKRDTQLGMAFQMSFLHFGEFIAPLSRIRGNSEGVGRVGTPAIDFTWSCTVLKAYAMPPGEAYRDWRSAMCHRDKS